MPFSSLSTFDFSSEHDQSLFSSQPMSFSVDPSSNRPNSAQRLDSLPNLNYHIDDFANDESNSISYRQTTIPTVPTFPDQADLADDESRKSKLGRGTRPKPDLLPSSHRLHPSSYQNHHQDSFPSLPHTSTNMYPPPSVSSHAPDPTFPLPPTSFTPSDGIWTSVNPFEDSSSSDKGGPEGGSNDGEIKGARRSAFFLPTAVDGEPVRTVQACQSCRTRKAKCDGLETCSRCIKHGLACAYGPPRRIRGPNKSRSIPSLPKSNATVARTAVPPFQPPSASVSMASSAPTPLFTTKVLASKQPFCRGSVVDLDAMGLGQRKQGGEGKAGGSKGKMDETLARIGSASAPSKIACGGKRELTLSFSPSSTAINPLPLVSPGSQQPHHLSVHITPSTQSSYRPSSSGSDHHPSHQQPYPNSMHPGPPSYYPQPPSYQFPVQHSQHSYPTNAYPPQHYSDPNPRQHPNFSERRRSSTISHRSHPYHPPSQSLHPQLLPSPTIHNASSPLSQPPSYPHSYFPTTDYAYPAYSQPTPAQAHYPASHYPSHFQHHRAAARASNASSTFSHAPTMLSSTTTSTSSPLPSPGGFSGSWDGTWGMPGGGNGEARRESYQSFDMVPPEVNFSHYEMKGGQGDGQYGLGEGQEGENEGDAVTPGFGGLDIRGWGDDS